jgi:hypothetical protein
MYALIFIELIIEIFDSNQWGTFSNLVYNHLLLIRAHNKIAFLNTEDKSADPTLNFWKELIFLV